MSSEAPARGDNSGRGFSDLGTIGIDAPAWIWPSMAVSAAVMFVLILLGGGGISLGSAIAMLAAFGAIGLVFTVLSRNSARLDLGERELEVRAGFGEERHRVPYRSIVTVLGETSGWVTVTYAPGGLAPSIGDTTGVRFRVKPHIAAPMLALRLEIEARHANDEQPAPARP